MNKLFLTGLVSVALGACASRPQPEPERAPNTAPQPPLECQTQSPARPQEHPLQAWIRYQQELLSLSRQGLEKRITETEKAMNAAPTGEAVMRHALSLAMSSQAGRQERALRLLNNLRLDPRLKPEEQHLAAIQAHHLGELRAALRERQRLEQRLAQEQQAKAALEDKIKALTTIELRMNERQRSETPPPETPSPETKPEAATELVPEGKAAAPSEAPEKDKPKTEPAAPKSQPAAAPASMPDAEPVPPAKPDDQPAADAPADQP